MLKLHNILRCGYTFSPDEYELETKYVMTTSALIIIFFLLFLSAIVFLFLGDDNSTLVYFVGAFLSLISLFLARIVGKDNYKNLVYVMTMLFELLIMYSYILKPDIEPVSSWIIIQMMASFLVLNTSIGILIGFTYFIFIIYMNEILNYHSLEYILLETTPVLIAIIFIFLIEKKFRSAIVLLEESNELLESRVEERTRDIEFEKVMLDHKAHYDELTDLPNRSLFHHELKAWILEKEKSKFALFFIDLDRFKRVNDSLGHAAGDKVLQIIARRINGIKPSHAFFSRISGDEFTLLFPHGDDINEIHTMAKEILESIEIPISFDVHTFYLSASIGIASFPDDTVYYADLIKYADASMFQAKLAGRGTFKFYAKEMTHRLNKTVLMEGEMHEAIDNKEFILYYQPQIDMRTGNMSGFEILVRWRHPTLGWILPNDFIGLAEDSGFIMLLDFYILRNGMKQVASWKSRGFDIPRVSFNFSTKHLQEKSFLDEVRNLLEETGCKGEWIELEITENHIVSDIEKAVVVLDELRSLGIEIAIDDFGTGYSSLTYLKKLPADKLKIDKTFIEKIPEDKVDMTIIEAIITIADSLDLTVIAEGVETQEQKEYLVKNGCFYAQGYLYHKAIPADEVEKLFFTK